MKLRFSGGKYNNYTRHGAIGIYFIRPTFIYTNPGFDLIHSLGNDFSNLSLDNLRY